MRLSGVHEGDIVECDVKGRRAFAIVKERDGQQLTIRPLPGQVFTWTHVTARQVIGHYRRRKA